MPQYAQNGRQTINNLKIGCFLIGLVLSGIASIINSFFLIFFIPLLFVAVVVFIIILVMKSSKSARRVNYTSTLASNFRKYGAGDWHTCQAVRAIVKDYYLTNNDTVGQFEFVNEWGNRYVGSIEINGTTHDITITADGSGNVQWDIV